MPAVVTPALSRTARIGNADRQSRNRFLRRRRRHAADGGARGERLQPYADHLEIRAPQLGFVCGDGSDHDIAVLKAPNCGRPRSCASGRRRAGQRQTVRPRLPGLRRSHRARRNLGGHGEREVSRQHRCAGQSARVAVDVGAGRDAWLQRRSDFRSRSSARWSGSSKARSRAAICGWCATCRRPASRSAQGSSHIGAVVRREVPYVAVSLASSPGEAGEETLRRATVHVLCWH